MDGQKININKFMNLKVLHLNVERNKHTTEVAKLLEEKNPDVVCFAEAMGKDIDLFVNKFGYNFVFSPRLILENDNDRDEEGVVILSKYKILNAEKHFYGDGEPGKMPVHTIEHTIVKDNVRPKNRFFDNYTFLNLLLELPDKKKINIATTHFPVVDHFLPGEKDHELKNLQNIDDLEHTKIYLDKIISLIRNIKGPLVFTADMNSARGEYFYDSLAIELVDRVPLSLKSSLDSKLHRVKHVELMVDAFMTTPDISVESFEVIEEVSDHKAFFVVLNVL